jgi:hypothetical protein
VRSHDKTTLRYLDHDLLSFSKEVAWASLEFGVVAKLTWNTVPVWVESLMASRLSRATSCIKPLHVSLHLRHVVTSNAWVC